VPIDMMEQAGASALLEAGCAPTAGELFDENGTLKPELRHWPRAGDRRMGANPHANGGRCCATCACRISATTRVEVPAPGAVEAQDMIELGGFVRDVFVLNREGPQLPRPFGPDETMSNRLKTSSRPPTATWMERRALDTTISRADGRVMDSMLSEHMCEGWLEGYLLTGRHGFFNSYEAFIRIVDSMFSQHAKWLKVCNELPWREPIASLNYVLTSNVWQQDHNGFTHQDPGLPRPCRQQEGRRRAPLSAARHQLPAVRYSTTASAAATTSTSWSPPSTRAAVADDGPGRQALHARHRHLGVGQQRQGQEPDVVMACCGDTPTLETLAAVDHPEPGDARAEDPRRQRRRPDALQPQGRASARPDRRGLRHASSRRTSRSSSPSTAIRR
jgi:xylulose-5-phosphate/fructose-6-phosphate phosphoketolase